MKVSWRLVEGSALDRPWPIADKSVQCIVTSPPYWALRDYHHEAQIGQEKTPEEYIERMADVFAEAHRVLRDDGLLWIVIGDCFSVGSGKIGKHPGGGKRGERARQIKYGKQGYMKDEEKYETPPNRMPIPGFKPKDLIGIPFMLAFALRARGWYWRQCGIWSKPNPMTESVADRPTTSHEYILLFAKNAKRKLLWRHRDGRWVRSRPKPDVIWRHRDSLEEVRKDPRDKDNWAKLDLWRGFDYFFEKDAIAEPQVDSEGARRLRERVLGLDTRYNIKRSDGRLIGQTKPGRTGAASNVKARQKLAEKGTRNRRTVWTVDEEYRGMYDHLAAFLQGCIDEGIPFEAVQRACEKSWKTNAAAFLASGLLTVWGVPTQPYPDTNFACFPRKIPHDCILASTRPGDTVLDCFAGRGTTGEEALKLQRNFVGIELNPLYAQCIRANLGAVDPLFVEEAPCQNRMSS